MYRVERESVLFIPLTIYKIYLQVLVLMTHIKSFILIIRLDVLTCIDIYSNLQLLN